MIRHFCDECGDELKGKNRCKSNRGSTGPDKDSDRLAGEGSGSKPTPGVMHFEIMTGRGNTWNDGEFCKYCVLDAVAKLDDRPRRTMESSK